MSLTVREPRGSKSVVLNLPASGTRYAVELSTVDENLLIRIKDADFLDLLPLSSAAATRLMACLSVTDEEENAWRSFLTQERSIDQAVAFVQGEFT